jgi:hypothetical protein
MAKAGSVYQEMERAVKRIESLGRGDYIRGLELLEEARRAALQVKILEKELAITGP